MRLFHPVFAWSYHNLAPTNGYKQMKRTRFPKLLDIITVDDPSQIRALSNDPKIDRIFERRPFLNGLFLNRRLGVLSYQGMRFPHLEPRESTARADRQQKLWELFNSKAAAMAQGPIALEDLAQWIKGEGPTREPGILVQQIVGACYTPNYKATAESWAAALTVSKASRSKNFPQI